jgi:NAD(P)-dependent dehydrogenase (short-subunit alcohol dehydrogenase family)
MSGSQSNPPISEADPLPADVMHWCRHCAPRLGVTKDIAAAVLYLASDDSSYMTANDLVVDGGLAHV